MIKINLLPQEMMGGAGGPKAAASPSSGAFVVALVLIVVFGANAALGYYLFSQYSESEKTLTDLRAKDAKIKDELKKTELQYNDTKLNLDRMQKLIDVHESLDPPDGLLWARKLNQIPLLMPEGVFITNLDLVQKVTERETEASIKAKNEWAKARKGPQPPTIKEPVFSQTLGINGIAYVSQGSPNQRLEQITTFISNLRDKRVRVPHDEKESRFIDHFGLNIVYSPVTMERMERRDVSRFKVTFNTNPVTIK